MFGTVVPESMYLWLRVWQMLDLVCMSMTKQNYDLFGVSFCLVFKDEFFMWVYPQKHHSWHLAGYPNPSYDVI